MKLSVKKFIISVVVLTLLAFPLAFVMMANSDAFQAADAYIEKNLTIANNLGVIENVSFSYMGSNRLRFAGMESTGNFELKVKGAKRSGILQIYLKKSTGVWQVDEATLYQDAVEPVELLKRK